MNSSTAASWKSRATYKIRFLAGSDQSRGSLSSDMDLPQERLYYQYRRGTWTILLALLAMVLGACAGSGAQGGVPSPAAGLTVQSGESLAVIGVQRDGTPSRNGETKSLQDQRVGFGLNSLLAESLFDTGKFRLIEEKDVH